MGLGKLLFRGILFAALVSSIPVTAQQNAIDLSGREVNPFTGSSGKPVVLVFLRRDCPVSGRYTPTIQQISQRYSDQATFWLVYPDKTETADAIRKSVAEYGYKLPVVRDPEHQLVRIGSRADHSGSCGLRPES